MRRRLKKLTGCLAVLVIAFLNLPASAVIPVSVTASTPTDPKDRFGPEHVIDGDLTTRWSSAHGEPHWIAFDFGEVVELYGLRLHWETAFGQDYDIEVSDDGITWRAVYTWRDGSGGIDDIYFGQKETRYLRMMGLRRGTGWGFSLFEVEFYGSEYRRSFSSSEAQVSPEVVMDGHPTTSWKATRAVGDDFPHLEVSLPESTEFGGVSMLWGETQARPWMLSIREEGTSEWIVVGKMESADRFQELYLERSAATALRFDFMIDEGEMISVAEIALKGPDETWNPLRHFEMLARRLPVGTYPWWLRREQGFFTVVGRPGSEYVSIIDEDGRVEPRKGSPSVTPLLIDDGQLRTARSFTVTQHLAEGWAPIPKVIWEDDRLSLSIEAIDFSESITDVVYTVENHTSENWEGSLVLILNPLQVNPPWQRGGFSPIQQALWNPQNGVLTANGETALRLTPPPSNGGVLGRSDRDISELLVDGSGWQLMATDADGLVSAGWREDLSLRSGEKHQLLARYSLDGSMPPKIDINIDEYIEQHRVEAISRWRELTGSWALDGFDDRYINFIRSNLAYLLINSEGAAIQPGSRNYQHSWIRDGSISATAMLYFGLNDRVRRYVEWMTDLVRDDGFVPFLVEAKSGVMPEWTSDWNEFDSFGQYVYMVYEYLLVSGDRELVGTAWPKVLAVMNRTMTLRDQRLGEEWIDTEFEGILPESNSHEGYFPAVHSHWDNFFALRGLADASALAKSLGFENDTERFAAAEYDFRTSILHSIERVRRRDGLDTIPASADLGDFDPTSTSIALMLGDERDTLPPDALQATYDRYMAEARERAQGGAKASSYTAYEGRNVGALLRLGRREDARWLLEWLMDDAIRPAGWNHMGEVTHPDPRQPAYIGDMPHTWVGSGMIHAIRDLFLFEDRGRLVLAAGLSEEELSAGVTLKDWQSHFGPVSYRVYTRDNVTYLDLDIDEVPPAGVVIPEGVKFLHKGEPAPRIDVSNTL